MSAVRETSVKRRTPSLTWADVTPGQSTAPSRDGEDMRPLQTLRGWLDHAACAGMAHDIWFEPIPSYISRARFVCSLCPVTAACVAAAIQEGDYGIRGGLTHEERSVLCTRRLPVSYARQRSA